MVLLESLNLPLGSSAEDFLLKGVDGKFYSLKSFVDAKVLVMVFMCNHCPYVQAVWGRLVDLQERFKSEGVQFVGINSNIHPNYPDDSFESMKKYYDEYEMNFPYLVDETQKVAKLYRAQCTPDIYVFDGQRELSYHGRIDDNWKDETQVSKHELADAIEALLHGKSLIEPQYPSMGCSIKWLE